MVLSGGSSREGVLCGKGKGARSSQVCDMTCVREDDCLKKDNTTLQQCDLEPWSGLSATREKMFACAVRARCGVLFAGEASHGVVCGSKKISVYEMRKKQQKHDVARRM